MGRMHLILGSDCAVVGMIVNEHGTGGEIRAEAVVWLLI
jgi:hypothetical protein